MLTPAQVKDHPVSKGKFLRKLPGRLVVVFAGIVLGQSLLYGPCLIGRKILLPLDLLALPGVYLPRTDEVASIKAWDTSLSDLVTTGEPARRFISKEFRAGRWPLWTPHYFAGAPFSVTKLSPFLLIEAAVESPVCLAWSQLAAALIAGLGMYVFCRRALEISFWPATLCAWCYPLTGAMVLWQGFPLRPILCWFPWLLVAVQAVVRHQSRLSLIGLSLATFVVLTAGQLDFAGQVLLFSGLFGVWCVWSEHGRAGISWAMSKACLGLTVGWGLGFMLAAPYVLPVIEYGSTGERMTSRGSGLEERPPGGVWALPLIVMPDYYGRRNGDTFLVYPFQPWNLQESAAGAYAGVIATLVICPLAGFSRKHRSKNLFLAAMGLLGAGWWLDVPLIVDILRLPGLNMMSHNRLVFATSFSLLALAGIGLNAVLKGELRWARWHWLLLLPVTGICCIGFYHSLVLPTSVATHLPMYQSQGVSLEWIRTAEDVKQVQWWFVRHFLVTGLLGALGLGLWLWIRLGWAPSQILLPILALAFGADLFWFARARCVQADPALYFPRVPALQQLADSHPGRVLGYGCLSANLASTAGLCDVRGYDGVDPKRFMQLLAIVGNNNPAVPEYARSQNFVPEVVVLSNRVQISPLLDLLGVSHLIFRGAPATNVTPQFQSFDYYVLPNPKALPRAFVPRKVALVAEEGLRLARLASAAFNPSEIAFVESPVKLPEVCQGTAEIVEDLPSRIRIESRMQTAGLVVLADLWDQGWKAFLDGESVPILKADHALRGVVVPFGRSTLEFRYEPADFSWGLCAMGCGVVTLIGLGAFELFQRHSVQGERAKSDSA